MKFIDTLPAVKIYIGWPENVNVERLTRVVTNVKSRHRPVYEFLFSEVEQFWDLDEHLIASYTKNHSLNASRWLIAPHSKITRLLDFNLDTLVISAPLFGGPGWEYVERRIAELNQKQLDVLCLHALQNSEFATKFFNYIRVNNIMVDVEKALATSSMRYSTSKPALVSIVKYVTTLKEGKFSKAFLSDFLTIMLDTKWTDAQAKNLATFLLRHDEFFTLETEENYEEEENSTNAITLVELVRFAAEGNMVEYYGNWCRVKYNRNVHTVARGVAQKICEHTELKPDDSPETKQALFALTSSLSAKKQVEFWENIPLELVDPNVTNSYGFSDRVSEILVNRILNNTNSSETISQEHLEIIYDNFGKVDASLAIEKINLTELFPQTHGTPWDIRDLVATTTATMLTTIHEQYGNSGLEVAEQLLENFNQPLKQLPYVVEQAMM